MKFIFKIALRYFFTRSGDRFISFVSGFCLLGTAIGVAALIIVMSIMNGFHQELIRCIIGTSGHVMVRSDNTKDLYKDILKYQFVKGVGYLVEGQGLISTNSQNTGVMIKGLSVNDFKLKKQLFDNLKGKVEDLDKHDSIFLGSELARNLLLRKGDKIRLVVPQSRSSIFGLLPKSKEFTVTGVITSGLTDYDSLNVIIPINTAEKLFNSDKILEIYTDNPSKVQDYTKILIQDLESNISFISNWQTSNSSILSTLKIEKTAMSMVLSLIIMVASFNIVSSLFMLVKDKSKDIAILRTIGASKGSIMSIFIFNGFMIGAIGTLAGIAISVPVVRNVNSIRGFLEYFSGITLFDSAIYFLYTLPAKIALSDVILVAIISLSTSLIATIYPAYRAAKLNPVEILRYE